MPDLFITDDNFRDHIQPIVNGTRMSHGCVPRDYSTHPVGYGAAKAMHALNFPLIPRDQWIDRIKEKTANKANLRNIRRTCGPNGGPIPSLDQDGIGYCWNHSVTMADMLVRALMGLPYYRLSAFFIGCLVKNYRDEGGWGALALDFAVEHGIPTVEFWPEKSMSRSNDNANTRANALLHKPTATWMDLEAAEYDRNMTEDQAMTCLLTDTPLVADFNWWSHSVCLLEATLDRNTEGDHALPRLEDLDLNNPTDLKVFGDTINKRGINSWTDSYGDMGEFVLTGSKSHPDGAVAPIATMPSIA